MKPIKSRSRRSEDGAPTLLPRVFGSRTWTAVVTSLGGGMLWATCFQPQSHPWLACVALVPLCSLAIGRTGFKWGFLHGVVYWALSMNWLAATLTSYGGLDPVLSWILLGCFALFFGVEHGAFVCLVGWISSKTSVGLRTLPAMMAMWVLLEVQRGFLWRGFPWNLGSAAWTDMTGALAMAPWIGAFGVSAVLVGVNAGLAIAFLGPTKEIKRRAFFGTFLLPLGLLQGLGAAQGSGGGSSESSLTAADSLDGSFQEIEVRLVQPNSPIGDQQQARANYRRLLELSKGACDQEALMIWPESAAWPELLGSPWGNLDRDLAELNALGCGVLVNTATAHEDRWRNSVVLVDGSPIGQYSKRRLVPWGEYVPLADWFPFIGRVARNAGDFAAGEDLGLISWRSERLGVAICYEIVFAAAVAEQVRSGATVLVTVTNDAWYGDTAAPWQHFRAARWRAAENRRPVLRAALTGVSAMISADGSVEQQLTVDETGVIRATVRGGRAVTLFSRAPAAVPVLSGLVLIFGIVRARKRRRPR